MKASHKKTLLIKLHSIQIPLKGPNFLPYELPCYLSFHHDEKDYFTPAYHTDSIFNEDILIPLTKFPQELHLYRWQNNMVVFRHTINISQLRSRLSVKKRHQVNRNQIVCFTVTILDADEIKFGQRFIHSIAQHYLMVNVIDYQLKNNQKSQKIKSKSLIVKISNLKYIIPKKGGILYIQLPEKVQFFIYHGGDLMGKSKQFASDQLNKSETVISLQSNAQIKLQLKWGINLHQQKTQNSLLIDSHDLSIYDISLKIESETILNNCKFKVVYGTKAFQLDDIRGNGNQLTRFKKILLQTIKSEDQEINFVIERKDRVIAEGRLYTEQVIPYLTNTIKKPIIEVATGKHYGFVKFKAEKAKNLSMPSNNPFWKQILSEYKNVTGGKSLFLLFQQISANTQGRFDTMVTMKTEGEDNHFFDIANMHYYHQQQFQSEIKSIAIKPQESVVMILRKRQNKSFLENQSAAKQQAFIGIGVLNPNDLRLGLNCVKIDCYKNQVNAGTLNLMVHKVILYPFVKSSFQPQYIKFSNGHSTINLSIIMKSIFLTAFFYTYRYDNKNELYCIVEVNKDKRVLILNSADYDELSFVNVAGSDSLNYYVDHGEFVKIKFTFLVSDIGQQQEIIGVGSAKVKITQLIEDGNFLTVQGLDLTNQFGTDIGQVNFQVHRNSVAQDSPIRKPKHLKNTQNTAQSGPFKSQIKKVQKDISKVNQSMKKIQRSFDAEVKSGRDLVKANNSIVINRRHMYSLKKQSSKNNYVAKLPIVKKKKDSNALGELVNMMRIRKRGMGGRYNQISFDNAINKNVPNKPFTDPSADLNISVNNKIGMHQIPQGSRPRRFSYRNNEEKIRAEIDLYEERLNSLRKQLKEKDFPKTQRLPKSKSKSKQQLKNQSKQKNQVTKQYQPQNNQIKNPSPPKNNQIKNPSPPKNNQIKNPSPPKNNQNSAIENLPLNQSQQIQLIQDWNFNDERNLNQSRRKDNYSQRNINDSQKKDIPLYESRAKKSLENSKATRKDSPYKIVDAVSDDVEVDIDPYRIENNDNMEHVDNQFMAANDYAQAQNPRYEQPESNEFSQIH